MVQHTAANSGSELDAARGRRRVAAACFVGTAIESYDYLIYGLASALVFGPLFFPNVSPVAGTLASFATFGAGFVARPFGGVLGGHLGDRIGRKKLLMVTLLLMGGATVLIGLLPGYDQIGVAAPVLLVTLRLLQGLAAGGEWGAAALMATEHAPPRRRGLFGSATQLGSPVGIILATGVMLGVSASLSDTAFESWGWRLPFLLSLVMILVGLYVRVRIEESPVFQELVDRQAKVQLPVVEVLRHNGKQVLLAMAPVIAVTALGYLFVAYLLSYGTAQLGMTRTSLLLVTLGGAFVLAITMIGFSAWSDRVGRRPVFLLSYGLLALWAIPFFLLVDTGSVALVAVACAVLVLGLAASQGPLAALLAEMFPAPVRCTGVSLSYALGAVLGGGFAPFIATALYESTGTSLSVSIYMIVVCLISMFAILAIRVPQHASLHDVAQPREADQARS